MFKKYVENSNLLYDIPSEGSHGKKKGLYTTILGMQLEIQIHKYASNCAQCHRIAVKRRNM